MTFEEICTCPLSMCPRHKDLVNRSLVSHAVFGLAKPSQAEHRMLIVVLIPIGSMYGIYANIWGILMVNVTIYSSTMDPMGFCGTSHKSRGKHVHFATTRGIFQCHGPGLKGFVSSQRPPRRRGPQRTWSSKVCHFHHRLGMVST